MSKRYELWNAMKAEADAVPLYNQSTGKPIILRTFFFKLPDDIQQIPTIEEIKEHYQERIEKFLWKDELRLVEELRIIVDKEKKSFNIFATCQPRRGANLFQKPKTLQDILLKRK